MIITLIGAVLFAAAAAGLLARAVALPRVRVTRSLAHISAYGFRSEEVAAEDAPRRSILDGLGAAVGRLVGAERVAAVRADLLGAGLYSMSPERFLAIAALAALVVPLLAVEVALSLHLRGPAALCVVVIGVLWGVLVPRTLIKRRARMRLEEIDLAMPELVDLLVVSVEAGLGFSSAMRAACARVKGPLGEELAVVMQEQTLGATMSDALLHLRQRCETPAVLSFVRTMTQGEKLGVSIGTMMRNLAEEMRKRRKASAEERAHKAPIKLLFPLAFCIFPALLVVLLTPAAISIIHSLADA